MPLPLKLFEVSDVVLKDETKGTNTHPTLKIIISTHLLDVVVGTLMHLYTNKNDELLQQLQLLLLCSKGITHPCSKVTDLDLPPLLTLQMWA